MTKGERCLSNSSAKSWPGICSNPLFTSAFHIGTIKQGAVQRNNGLLSQLLICWTSPQNTSWHTSPTGLPTYPGPSIFRVGFQYQLSFAKSPAAERAPTVHVTAVPLHSGVRLTNLQFEVKIHAIVLCPLNSPLHPQCTQCTTVKTLTTVIDLLPNISIEYYQRD